MASLIYNYAAIRSRMLGDLKARPEPKKSLCPKCGDVGWVVLVRGRPSCGFLRSVADCRYGYPY
jgi:hypothetical protein